MKKITKAVFPVAGMCSRFLLATKATAKEMLLVYRFNGVRYDCCSKLGYQQSQVAFGLKYEELREEFASYPKTVS